MLGWLVTTINEDLAFEADWNRPGFYVTFKDALSIKQIGTESGKDRELRNQVTDEGFKVRKVGMKSEILYFIPSQFKMLGSILQ